MGNANTIKSHIEHGQKSGVCQLASMNLNEFPPELIKLVRNLRTLDLQDNKIRALPEAIGNFLMLKSLNLSANRLSMLCQSVCKLTKLENLILTNNQITSMPAEFHQCKNLKHIHLSRNKLKSIDDSFSKLKHLDDLDLSQNQINGIPDSIKTLSALELNLNKNQISNLPDSLSHCPRLKVLRIEENCVSLDMISPKILKDSKICLVAYDGNLFSQKEFQEITGYDQYMERYTSTKKKFD